MLRAFFKILSLLALGRAISKGPSATGKYYLRRDLHRRVRRIR